MNIFPLRTKVESEVFLVVDEDAQHIISDQWETPPQPGQATSISQYRREDFARPLRRSLSTADFKRNGLLPTDRQISLAILAKERFDGKALMLQTKRNLQSASFHGLQSIGNSTDGHSQAVVSSTALAAIRAAEQSSSWEHVGAIAPPMNSYADLGCRVEPMSIGLLLQTIARLFEERLRLIIACASSGVRLQPWASFVHMQFIKQTGARSTARRRMAELIFGVNLHQRDEPRVRLFGLLTNLLNDAPPFAEGRIEFISRALSVLFGAPELVEAALLVDEAPILLSGKPRKLLLSVHATIAGAAAREVAVEIRSAEAVLQSCLHLSEEHIDELRDSLVASSHTPYLWIPPPPSHAHSPASISRRSISTNCAKVSLHLRTASADRRARAQCPWRCYF